MKKEKGKKGKKEEKKRGQIYLSATHNKETIDLLTTNRDDFFGYD